MSLRLKDIVYQVRSEIGELQEFNWSDYQIITDTNNIVQEMTSIAGTLTKFEKLTIPGAANGSYQEVELDVQVDKVKNCKYWSGQLFDLKPGSWKKLQSGSFVGGIPEYYYLKTSTRQLTPQTADTNNITAIDIQGGPLSTDYRTVLGVWPIIATPAQIQVWYSYYHPLMTDPTDPCEIPNRFLRGIAAGVIERCLRIEKAHDEADRYRQTFDEITEKYRIYASAQRQQDKPARYGLNDSDWRNNPSSSVVVVDPFPQGP